MAFSFLRLSPSSSPTFSSFPKASPIQSTTPPLHLFFSAHCYPYPRLRRKNHLRPKIPNFPLSPSPAPPPPPPPPPLPFPEHIESSCADGSSFLTVDEVDEVQRSFTSFDILNAFPPGADRRWFLSSVLDLAARFAILLVVQTTVAVCFLSRENVEEVRAGTTKDGFREKENVVEAEKKMVSEDFERMVSEIREMANHARKSEAEGNAVVARVKDHEGMSKGAGRRKKSVTRIFMDGQGEGLAQKRRQKRFKLRNEGVGYLPKVKGFGRSRHGHGSYLEKGGIQQIAHMNPVNESTKLSLPTKSDSQTSNLNSFENEDTKNVDRLSYISTETMVEESKLALENFMNNESMESRTVDTEENQKPSMLLAARYDVGVTKSMPGSYENQWWLKLSHVFGIFLHRGSESRDKGLYSLRMNSEEHDGHQHSYTVAFEDCGEAINFSFLLESFFEDLDNVRADIIPLTIQELDDAVRSGELKVIVARKGELSLYAGQPLVDVENALRSLLE